MKKWKVYLSEYIHPQAKVLLASECEIVDSFEEPEALDGILVRQIPVPDDVMRRAGKLKAIAVHGVGTDGVNLKLAEEKGVRIITTPGANSRSVAELAVGLILDLSRKISRIDHGLRVGEYSRKDMSRLVGSEITGKKVGIIGLGQIGLQIGKILKYGFDCDLYAYSSKDYMTCSAMGYKKVNSLEELFHEMDLISVNIPLNDDTRNMIDRELLRKSNTNLLLVNTARGGIINEDALYEALKNRWIRGAASDVFVLEPPAVDNPLLQLENFVATFHIGSNTDEALYRVGIQSVEGILEAIKE